MIIIKSMKRDLAKIADSDSSYFKINRRENPEYIEQRIKLIRNQSGWWSSLDRYQSGFDILDIAMDLEFQINILTKAARESPNSYGEKVLWLKNNMPSFESIKITHAENKESIWKSFSGRLSKKYR